MNSKLIVYISIIIRCLVYGSSVLFTGHMLNSIGVFDVLALRFMLTTGFFLIFIGVGLIKINFKGKNIRPLVMTAIFEPVIYFVFETFGIRGTTAAVAGIIFATTPLFVLILETIILRETSTNLQKILLLFGIVGAITVVLGSAESGENNEASGIICAFLATFSGALFIIFSRKSTKIFSPMEVTFFTSVTGAISFNLLNVCIHIHSGTLSSYFTPLFQISMLAGFIFLSLFSSIVATFCDNFAILKLQPSSVSTLGGLSTVITIVEDMFINHERLMWFHIAGTLLIMIGGISINYLRNIQHTGK